MRKFGLVVNLINVWLRLVLSCRRALTGRESVALLPDRRAALIILSSVLRDGLPIGDAIDVSAPSTLSAVLECLPCLQLQYGPLADYESILLSTVSQLVVQVCRDAGDDNEFLEAWRLAAHDAHDSGQGQDALALLDGCLLEFMDMAPDKRRQVIEELTQKQPYRKTAQLLHAWIGKICAQQDMPSQLELIYEQVLEDAAATDVHSERGSAVAAAASISTQDESEADDEPRQKPTAPAVRRRTINRPSPKRARSPLRY